MTVAQTLSVIHGLAGNVKIIMEGAECSVLPRIFFQNIVVLDGKASADSIQQDLSMSCAEQLLLVLTWVVVTIRNILNELNKTKRKLFSPCIS